jgi:predicted amidophosphoribosyltransferase
MRTDPLRIVGPWDAGFTLDVHTISAEYLGDDLHGHPQFETVRSELGEALFRLKYRDEREASVALASVAAEFVRLRGFAAEVVVPVPPSRVRSFQPLAAIASRLAAKLGAAYDPTSLRKVRETPELKSMVQMAEREAALAGAFAVRGSALAGKHVLLFDDLYRSGASMREAARTLRTQGPVASLTALALTRTRSRS